MERSAQSMEMGWGSTWDQNGPAEFASHEARIGYVANTENNIETFIEQHRGRICDHKLDIDRRVSRQEFADPVAQSGSKDRAGSHGQEPYAMNTALSGKPLRLPPIYDERC